MREIDYKSLSFNPMTMVGDEWLALTAGTKEGGFNAMTCSWGHMGNIWNKPSIVVYVRPQRYTKEFMDKEDLFTVSFFDDHKKELSYIGSHSGRDEDKISTAGLNPVFEDGFTYFKEAKLVFVCRKLYRATLQEDGFICKETMDRCYPEKDFHDMYVGEIVKVLAE